VVLVAGVALTAPSVLGDGLPALLAAPGWMVAGLGIGLAYPSGGALALAQAPPGGEGGVSAALQIVETVGVALFTGVGGAAIAAGLARGWDPAVAFAAIFGAAVASGLAGLAAGRRLAAPVEEVGTSGDDRTARSSTDS
jgi:hypothetical protein